MNKKLAGIIAGMGFCFSAPFAEARSPSWWIDSRVCVGHERDSAARRKDSSLACNNKTMKVDFGARVFRDRELSIVVTGDAFLNFERKSQDLFIGVRFEGRW